MHTFKFYLLFLSSLILCSCISNGNDPSEPAIPEDIEYQRDVIFLNELMVDSVSIINDTTITMYSTKALADTLKPGRKFVYSHSKTSKGFCLGIIKQVDNNSPAFHLQTSIPSFDEIFSELPLTPEFNLTNLQTDFVADESDNVIFNGLVDNSIWNEIETIYREDTTEVAQSPLRAGTTTVPIDITLSFDIKPTDKFSGTIYLRLEGSMYIHNCRTYEMELHQTVGVIGSFAMAEASIDRKHIPLLQIKNGITIYSNKIVGIRIKPSLNFFYGGGIKLEAGFKYDLINADIRSVFDGNDVKSFTSDNLKDYYFRVKSLHSEGEFGLSMTNDLYAFVFTDNFFAAGVNTEAGLSISGEKNVGIQFPDIANFDFSVMFTPFLEITPFAKIRTPQLKRFDGPTFKMKTETFAVDLLPNIHNINYEKKNDKLKVTANVIGVKTSFIESKETGMALFAKGNDTPIAYQPINSSSTSAPQRVAFSNDVEFDINDDQEYELAKYTKTKRGEIAFGERLLLEDDAVDLELPSGLKWRRCNLGANSPEEFGDYFAWGETSTKNYYDRRNYKFYYLLDHNWLVSKYNNREDYGHVDNKSVLELEDDAAHVILGGDWRMPTRAEMEELINNTTFSWTNNFNGSGVSGHVFQSTSNGNYIFLPDAGWLTSDDSQLVGERGFYWTSEIGHRPYFPLAVELDEGYYELNSNWERCNGLPIRPVHP